MDRTWDFYSQDRVSITLWGAICPISSKDRISRYERLDIGSSPMSGAKHTRD